MDSDTLLTALALVLVIEGLLPFLSPGGWRRMFAQLLQLQRRADPVLRPRQHVAGLVLIWLLALKSGAASPVKSRF